ncbi:HesA/MoeB/ThiF family protein [Altererythrobacter sp. Root672]|uniref:HesA/MoeB/ThiF family protein n=1 Tax=Altererythrobacter sp. Root672 TaxID=1736584 RepID=UPI0006F9490D|nr:HesA/MoeB/ThiF family protein [Altererythrobacter sp. Root672]KRA81283.1 molybdopterin biosynthesis protein MoeB [Altererythrobacter sp. Root672]
MTLPPERLERFARHIVLPEIGGAGQAALASAKVVLIGVGGIGSPALQYLAGAGIGSLVLIDDDTVDVTNLQRQTIFREHEVTRGKADLAAAWVREFDAHLDVRWISDRITSDNAGQLIEGADLVLDGCDNFATRLAVSDACVAAGIPLLSAAVGRFQGQVGAFAGHLPDQACYRCYVGDAFDADDCDTCAEDGMLGAMAGWTATFAALQAIRVLLAPVGGLGDPQWGKLHLLDGLAPSMRTLNLAKDPACRACSSGA